MGKNRLRALHVHDVDGFEDSHTLPYYGVTNWDLVAKALKEIGYEGDFTFEVIGFLTKLPKALYPSATTHLVSTGRHIMSQILN